MTEQTDRLSQLSEPHRALLERMTAPAGQREGLFPATAAQRSLWFTDQLTPGTSTYNIPALLRLRGPLDHARLASALQGLVDGHEALRTTLVAVDGVPLQDVRAAREQQVTVINAAGRAERDVIAEAIGAAHRPFDLAAGPLMRSTLWRLGPADHLLLVVVHHSMADGWSLGVLLDDLAASLDGRRPGGAGPAAALHPVDLALAEAAASDDAPSAAFWAERLAGASPPGLTRPAAPAGPACGTLLLPLDAGAPGQARDLARRLGVTEYAVYFAALAAVCHRAAGQRDLVLGASFARRSGRGLERIVGLLVNALPVRLAWSGDPGFSELVTLAGQALRTSMAHGSLPLERIIQDSARHRAGGRTPFLDVVFALNRDPLPARQLGGCDVERVEVPPRTAKFPLLASVDFEGQRARICCEYDRGLLDDEFVAGLAGMLRHLLEHLAEVAAVALGEIPLQSPGEEAARVRLAHGPAAADVLGGRGFGAVVAAIARREPGRAAITEDGRQVTYGELVTAADGLARALRARGAGQDGPVAVALPRGIDQITACLAVIRAGSYYLPLDPENPVGRNRHMLSEAGGRLLVAGEGYADRLGLPGIVALPPPPPGAPATGGAAPQDVLPGAPPGRPGDLALVGYTSGSTGQPKGFATTQRGIARLLGDRRYLPADPERVFLIANAVTFDASTWEIWNTLLTGSRGVVVPRYGYTARGLRELIRAHGATAAHVTTQLFNEIVDEDPEAFAPLAELVIGGEAMSAEHVRKARRCLPGTRLLNAYGPAECSVMATMEELQTPPPDARQVPIGGPLADTEVYLLDAAMRPVPAGALGELYVGGPGVARGYVGQPGLTAERFVPSPFGAGSRLYRTGDLARAAADGSVTYLGRADQQLKIRGFRVEPGEIESRLTRHPAVAEAVVALSAAGAEPALVAYVVTTGGELPVAQVREFLRRDLPDYMVPSAVVTLERLPLTPNGKVDRGALPAPGLPLPPARRAGPGGPLERVVLEVWAEVLGRAPDAVSVHDDFFEIGGHSLLASRAAARLERRTGHAVPLRLMFDHPTVAGLAEALGRTPAQRRGPALAPVPRRGALPLSFAQERLWFLHRLAPEAPLYNLPFALRLTGELRTDLLHRALVLVADRHEALRTVFGADAGGVPYQRVLAGPDVALSVVRVTGDRAMRRRLAGRIVGQAALAPFDLAVDLPIRATVAKIAPREHVLLVTVHHIACDGWSVRLLAEEVSVAYAALLGGAEPGWAELGVQYGDFAVWQRERLSGEVLAAELAHWGRVLAGAPAVLELPADHPRPAVFGYRGAGVPVALGAELTAAVRRLAAAHRVTPFMVLVAGLAVVLGRYAGQDDVVIGTPVAGRPDPLVEGLIGFFANTLVLRVDVSGDPTVGALLDRVRAVCLDAYGHQEVPFERLVEHLQPERDLSRTPVFQVMLALQNEPLTTITLPGLDVTVHPVENPTAKYDLVFTLREEAAAITGVLEYNSDLFEPATAAEIRDSLVHVLGAVASGAASAARDLPLQGEAATRELLSGWNRVPSYDPETCLHDLVARQVAATPDAVAVISDEPGQTLTYRELDRRAGHVARLLRQQGAGPGDLVAVLLPRSADLVAALLGVLRCGAGFLPLDPEHPPERLAAILADAGAVAAITTAGLRGLAPGGLLMPGPADAGGRAGEHWPRADPGGLAYAIYTSGSTGRPKGVLIEHRAICGNLLWMQQDWPLGPGDRVLQKTTIAFDVAVKEIFWPLLCGAALVLARPGGQRDAEYLMELIDRHGITVAHFVPSMLDSALSHAERTGRAFGASLQKVMAGAETLPAATLRRFFAATRAELLHMYGPTETAIAVTGWTCPRDRVPARVPLGRPMPGVQLYVLDSRLRPVPRGAWGELYVGGTCVGRGYLGQPAETAAAFMPDPYSGRRGARLYRTGDIVRISHERLLEFRGRVDDQVKVRGFRIELGEIEAALTRHPGVRQAAVVARRGPDGGSRALAGYVSAGDPGLTEQALRDHLRDCLPDYMIPSLLVILPELPLNANGKIDRGRLPAAGPPPARSDGGTPREQAVADILAAVLELAGIGPDDDLFALGGHSLQVPQIAALIAERTGVEIPLRDIFLDPTVAGIARAVEQGDARRPPAITRVDRAARRRQAGTS